MKPASILIVEDDKDLRIMLEKFIPEVIPGAEPRFETSGEKAGKALAEIQRSSRPCALVITDVLLEGSVTGVDLLVSCHQRFPDLPFLLTSGLPEEFARGLIRATQIEAAILPKPFTLKQLKEKCSLLVRKAA